MKMFTFIRSFSVLVRTFSYLLYQLQVKSFLLHARSTLYHVFVKRYDWCKKWHFSHI